MDEGKRLNNINSWCSCRLSLCWGFCLLCDFYYIQLVVLASFCMCTTSWQEKQLKRRSSMHLIATAGKPRKSQQYVHVACYLRSHHCPSETLNYGGPLNVTGCRWAHTHLNGTQDGPPGPIPEDNSHNQYTNTKKDDVKISKISCISSQSGIPPSREPSNLSCYNLFKGKKNYHPS